MLTGKLISNQFKTGQNEGHLCDTNQSLFVYFHLVLPSITESICQGQESWVLAHVLNMEIPIYLSSLFSSFHYPSKALSKSGTL